MATPKGSLQWMIDEQQGVNPYEIDPALPSPVPTQYRKSYLDDTNNVGGVFSGFADKVGDFVGNTLIGQTPANTMDFLANRPVTAPVAALPPIPNVEANQALPVPNDDPYLMWGLTPYASTDENNQQIYWDVPDAGVQSPSFYDLLIGPVPGKTLEHIKKIGLPKHVSVDGASRLDGKQDVVKPDYDLEDMASRTEMAASPQTTSRFSTPSSSSSPYTERPAETNGALSYLGNTEAEKDIALRGHRANLLAQDYTPLEQNYIASDNTAPADIYYKEEDGKTRYEIPGLNAIGGGAGYAEFQGKRKGGGSFSVMPGLSQYERKQLAEIEAREKNQRDRDELAAFMNQFTQPPGDMNPMQAQLWGLQQKQLETFVKLQTEQQAAARLAEMKALQERQAARQEQANKDREFEAGQNNSRAKLYQDAQVQRTQAAQQNAQITNRMISDASKELQPWYYQDMQRGGATTFNHQGFAERSNIMDKPADTEQMTPGDVYRDPATGWFVGSTNDGIPVMLTPEFALLVKQRRMTLEQAALMSRGLF